MNHSTFEFCIVGVALFVVQGGVIVVGVALDSEAMQWTGFVVITVVLLAGVLALFERVSRARDSDWRARSMHRDTEAD